MRITHTILSFLLASIFVIISSCGGSSASNPNLPPSDPSDRYTFAASNLPRNQNPDVPGGDFAELVTGNTNFAFDLYEQLMTEDGNMFFSPFSISQALAMAYAGARGNTETQIADVMHFTLGQDGLHPAFNKLDLELHSRGAHATNKGGDPFQLNIANSTWGQNDWTWQTPFLDTLALNYGAGMRMVDFKTDPETCRVTINDWVESRTENKIQELLKQGVITVDTRLVLVNAIYFNAAWLLPFIVENTTPGDFHLSDGSTVSVPMMYEMEDHGYMEGDGYQACDLLYDGEELSMTIVLPDDGRFADVENSLNADFVNTVVSGLQNKKVEVTMPKFQYDSEFSLTQTLQDMGMTDAFNNADFSGLDGGYTLAITDVVHKAFVSVDEEGTEAAAATAAVFGEVSMPETVKFILDRPFIFFIRDLQTGAILFIGRVVNPS
ncbi:MAG: serpin family protein [bacterium]|nr:serpin family protein [bacterium]